MEYLVISFIIPVVVFIILVFIILRCISYKHSKEGDTNVATSDVFRIRNIVPNVTSELPLRHPLEVDLHWNNFTTPSSLIGVHSLRVALPPEMNYTTTIRCNTDVQISYISTGGGKSQYPPSYEDVTQDDRDKLPSYASLTKQLNITRIAR